MAKEDAKVVIGGDAQKAVNAIKDVTQHMGSMGKGMNDFLSQATGFFSWQTAAVAGLGAVATGFASLMKNAIDTADEFANMSKRTGVAVESLSRLAYAAKMSDTSNETLQKSLKFLNVALYDVSTGNKAAIDKFKEFGVEVVNADGSVKNAEQALVATADAYVKLTSEAAKTKLATELFGKAGQELMPMLSEGGAGIRALAEEAEKMGVVISSKAAATAEEFNDKLDKMKTFAQGVAIQVMEDLIPSIDSLNTEMDEFNATGNAVNGTAKLISTGIDILTTSFKISTWASRLFIEALGDMAAAADKAPKMEKYTGKWGFASMLMSAHDSSTKSETTKTPFTGGSGNKSITGNGLEPIALPVVENLFETVMYNFDKLQEELSNYNPFSSGEAFSYMEDPEFNPILKFTDTALTAQLAFIKQSKTAWDIYGKDVQMSFADNMAVMGDAYGQALGGFAGMFEAFANAQDEQMGVMFETARAFRAAEIIASTWTSAQKAYEFGMSFGPWTAGIMMASAIATGIGNLTNLYATQPGNSSINGAGTAPTPNYATRNPQTGGGSGSGTKNITVKFEGFIWDKDRLAREIIPAINKAISDGTGR